MARYFLLLWYMWVHAWSYAFTSPYFQNEMKYCICYRHLFDTIGGETYTKSLSLEERRHNCFHARAAKLRSNGTLWRESHISIHTSEQGTIDKLSTIGRSKNNINILDIHTGWSWQGLGLPERRTSKRQKCKWNRPNQILKLRASTLGPNIPGTVQVIITAGGYSLSC